MCLTEGNEILVTISRDPKSIVTVSRQYRMVKPRPVMGGAGPQIDIIGIYDAPKFTSECGREAYSGSSESVLQQLAAKCKLQYDGPSSVVKRSLNDNQVWINTVKTRAAFAQHYVARHGYIDNHSAMVACLTSMGILKYRNLSDVIEKPVASIKYAFVVNTNFKDDSKIIYNVIQAREMSNAGVANITGNYGSTKVIPNLEGEHQINSEVQVKTSGKFLPINDKVYKTIDRSKLEYGYIDCGNVHPNFEKAHYQNLKLLSLFSERQSILVRDVTEVQLLDPVLLIQSNNETFETARASDIYIVVGKTIAVCGGSDYYERLELVRMTLTELGDGTLKGMEPTSIRESTAPDVIINSGSTNVQDMQPVAKSIDETMKPAEEEAQELVANSSSYVNSASNALPQAGVMASNMDAFDNDPQKSLNMLQRSMAGLRAFADSMSSMKDKYETVKYAAEDAKYTLESDGMSPIAKAAAFARPGGIVQSFSASMGMLNSTRMVADLYGRIADKVASSRGYIESNVGGGAVIDEFLYHSSIASDSSSQGFGSAAGLWNDMVGVSNDSTIPFDTSGYGENTNQWGSMISGSLIAADNARSPYRSNLDNLRDVEGLMALRDDNGSNSWVDPSSASSLSFSRPSNIVDHFNESVTSINYSSRQLAEGPYNY